MKPLAVFDVRPEARKRWYFRVKVWATLRELRGYVETSAMRRAHAVTVVYPEPPVSDDKYLSAEILFAKRYLTHEILTHECQHAILGWAHLLGIDVSASVAEGLAYGVSTSIEERVCYAMGRAREQIAAELGRAGFTIR